MRVELHDDQVNGVDEVAFATAVGGWLEQREAENSLFLGVLGALKRDPPAAKPFMARVISAGETVFAAIYRELNLIVSRGPEAAIDATAARLATRGIAPPGVIGPAREAERFALVWARSQGCGQTLIVNQRIYQLTQICWPPLVPGQMRPMVLADLDLVVEWSHGFETEALQRHEHRPPAEARSKSAKRIVEGNLFGWAVDGQLVAMAGLARPTSKTISVNGVYTPPAHRRRGFATALVAAVSEAGLKRGKPACVLYTDLANPTANSIYQKLGYQPICDSRHYRFTPP